MFLTTHGCNVAKQWGRLSSIILFSQQVASASPELHLNRCIHFRYQCLPSNLVIGYVLMFLIVDNIMRNRFFVDDRKYQRFYFNLTGNNNHLNPSRGAARALALKTILNFEHLNSPTIFVRNLHWRTWQTWFVEARCLWVFNTGWLLYTAHYNVVRHKFWHLTIWTHPDIHSYMRLLITLTSFVVEAFVIFLLTLVYLCIGVL